MKNNTISVRQITLIGLMSAIVYVTSAFMQIPIVTAVGNTRLHMGNVMCLLSGLLLGPVYGGLSAGIGSAFFDLTNPAYIASLPFTFAFKFLMAWVCGSLFHQRKENGVIAAALAGAGGAITYVILYLLKSFVEAKFVMQMPMSGVITMLIQKGSVSLTNAIIAVIVAVPLSMAIRPLIKKKLQN